MHPYCCLRVDFAPPDKLAPACLCAAVGRHCSCSCPLFRDNLEDVFQAGLHHSCIEDGPHGSLRWTDDTHILVVEERGDCHPSALSSQELDLSRALKGQVLA